MQRIRRKEPKNNLKLATLFFAIFLFFIVISVSFRFVVLVKNSSFDGKNIYNVEFVDGQKRVYASFSPKEKSISILRAQENDDVFAPVDGIINSKLDSQKITSTLVSQLISPSSHKDMTVIDLVRIALFSRSVPETSVYERSFVSQAESKTTFRDPKIIEEAKSIEIINSTEVAGLGNKLANFISNLGGNVILVKSEDSKASSQIMYYGEKSYTF